MKQGNLRTTGKEQFYTPIDIAHKLVKDLDALICLNNKTIIEPSAGTGSFIKALNNLGYTAKAFDIEPKYPEIIKQNYLETNEIANVVLGNPPFGRNNSLSIPFFNKAAKTADYIAFIIPRSWRKWSVSNRLNTSFHLIEDKDIQIDYENDLGNKLNNSGLLRTCWQVWEKRNYEREIVKIPDYGLIKKTKPELANVAITVFGYGCGKVETEFERRKNSTKLYLQADKKTIEILKTLNYQEFSLKTATIEALSFQEINYLLNKSATR